MLQRKQVLQFGNFIKNNNQQQMISTTLISWKLKNFGLKKKNKEKMRNMSKSKRKTH